MSERTDRIRLPQSEARCFPSGTCTMQQQCARAQAAMPPQGGATMDGYRTTSMAPGGAIHHCGHYIAVLSVEIAAPIAKPVKPWIGDAT